MKFLEKVKFVKENLLELKVVLEVVGEFDVEVEGVKFEEINGDEI